MQHALCKFPPSPHGLVLKSMYNSVGSCMLPLKVGSCPKHENWHQILFCRFLCSIWRNFIFWICCCWENRKSLLRFHVFSFVYFLCVGIPIQKIVLSNAHKWVISDVILLNISFRLSWAILGVQAWWMGKHYPKMQCSITISTLSIFGARTKIALTGVRSRVRKSLASQLI